MEEESKPVLEEETSAPSASETESAPEAETSEAATSEQPAEEETVSEDQPKGRAQERITKLASKAREAEERANYWEDLAKGNQPSEPSEEGEVTVDEIVNKLDERLSKKEAHKTMVQDAYAAIDRYPELDTDDDLAADVLALARGRGISMVAAADRVIGRRNDQIQATDQAKSNAETAHKASAAAPTSKKVATGEAPPIDLSTMSEEEKAANWGTIVSDLASK